MRISALLVAILPALATAQQGPTLRNIAARDTWAEGGLAERGSSCMYVGNLAYGVTESELHGAFSRYGSVVDVKVMNDRATGQSRGFAFVTFSSAQSMQKAIHAMNGQTLAGRPLKLTEGCKRR